MNTTINTKRKWLVATLAVMLVIALSFTLVACGTSTATDNKGQSEIGNSETPMRVALAASPMSLATTASGTTTVSKTITATVLPVDAPDKSVDWTIEWCVPIEGEEVTDYLTVTPESDGALTATITAYRAFEGASAYVKATTRVGGYTATCLVAYEGAPESLSFVLDGTEYGSTDTVDVVAGSTNNFALNLKNTLGVVGSKYGTFEIVKIQGQGRFTMLKEYVVNGSVRSSEDIVFNLEVGTYSYTDEVSGDPLTLTIGPDAFFDVSIDGDTMIVNAKRSESSYINGYPRTGYRFSYKGTYTDPRSGGIPDDCRWYILVRDTVSGEEALIYVDIESTVNSISLNNTYLAF